MTTAGQDDRARRLEEAIRARRAGARPQAPEIPPRPAGAPALLGAVQRGLWFAHQMAPSSPAYNLASAFRVPAPLDAARLQRALDTVVTRHRLLRSTFVPHGDTARQVVHERLAVAVELERTGPGEALAAATRAAAAPFDLAAGPLLRMGLVEESAGDARILFLALHHILADERALAVLWQELQLAYDGLPAGPLPVQCDDVVHWQGQAGSVGGEALDYWRRRLDPLPEDLQLPIERATADGSPRGRLLARRPDTAALAGIRRLAASAGATPFMVCAFAFRLLLHRYTGGRPVAFATPVSTRAHAATADMVGYFLNPIVVTATLDEQERVDAAAASFCRDLRDALGHASVPFDVLAANLAPHRQPDRHPIFQSMFVFQEAGAAPRLGGVQLEPVVLDLGASKFDLTLFVTERDGALEAAAEYRADRFEDAAIGDLLEHYATLLGELPAEPSRSLAAVPMLPSSQQERLLAWERGPRLEGLGHAMLPRQVLDAARRAPEAPAVVCAGAHHTYGDLGRRARAVAVALAGRGVRPGDRVGVFLQRGVGMIAAIAGTHWAGAAYVPLDPAYPAARSRDVLKDAGVAAVLTTAALRARLPDGAWTTIDVGPLGGHESGSWTPVDVAPDDIAYLLYTSGSTGRPKGVVVTHGNLDVSTRARVQVYDAPPSRFLLLPSVAFDSSVAGLFWTLAAGGTLVVPTDEEARDARRLARLVAEQRVTALLCVPSLYAQLLEVGGEALSTLEIAIVAGETCPPRLVAAHARTLPRTRLFNEYGPTEATVWATVHEATPGDARGPVAIGRPIPGVRVEVLDVLGRRVPPGVPGQGWVVGPTVARGYWGRPDLTAERFAEPSGNGGGAQRRYRTGDAMTWTRDGRLLFLGRDDEQIKLRGFRIEAGEVEAALLELPGVEQAAVVARAPAGVPAADQLASQLVAFIVSRTPGAVGGWREALAARLPDFSVPSRLVELPALPRLPNGKVDRRALRERALDPETRPAGAAAIPSDLEQGLTALWEGLLGRPGIGPTDNFFELGGHSLLVVQMLVAIERDFDVALAAADVFAHPTVHDLAGRIASSAAGAAPPYQHLFPIQPAGDGAPFVMAIPHFFSQMLAARFRGERPVYGLRGVGLRAEGNDGRWPTMGDLATDLVDEIVRRFPNRPCILGGYSFGASMAIEAARVMEQRGLPVLGLYVIAPMPLDIARVGPLRLQIDGLREPASGLSAAGALRRYARVNHPLTWRPYRRAWRWLTVQPWRRLLRAAGRVRRRAGLPLTPRILHADVRLERFRLHAGYRPGPVRTPTVFFNAMGTDTDAAATWRPCFTGPLAVHDIPDPHDEASVEAARRAILPHLDAVGDA
jgi:amino acid adenylation domain-containing protein